jgi:hypothetical protein
MRGGLGEIVKTQRGCSAAAINAGERIHNFAGFAWR